MSHFADKEIEVDMVFPGLLEGICLQVAFILFQVRMGEGRGEKGFGR
jgi:hypothetical protein